MSHRNRPRVLPDAVSRREFLRRAGLLGVAATLLPDRLLADPYQPYLLPRAPGRPLRIRGVVRAEGRGVAGVPVTDGIRIVDTLADGTFELVSDTARDHVYLSLPSGYRIPTNPTGTARFYQPIQVGPGGEMEAEFSLEPIDGEDENHTMLLLADIQTETAEEMEQFHRETVPDLQATVGGLGEERAFAMACGDILFDDLSFFPEYERAVRQVGIPAFQVVGNHDLDFDGATDESSTRTFRNHFGPAYYSFDRGHVHYVVLDDVFWHSSGYLGYLDSDQLTWLERDLSRVEAGRPVVISLHIPVEGTRDIRMGGAQPSLGGSVSNRDFLYRMVEPYATHFLSGHTHDGEHTFLHGTHAQISGTVCGAWWTGPICGDGTPKGYGVYQARGEEIRWRYKATGHGDDHQIRAYPRGAVPGAPDEVVANVWNWDPAWQVVLYEGADRRGPMASRVEQDPLAVELYGPDGLPEKRPWVRPYPTRHLFFAPVEADHGELRVVAIGRFGREFSAPVPAPTAS
jgi:hypothetical protein